jgi:uncharacterized phage infection (PIP) family protein YhgE
MSKAGKLIKDMLKAKKESVMGKLGDSPYEDPMEPWSAKYAQPVKEEAEQVDEGDRQTLAKKLTNKMYSIDKGLGKLAKDQNRTDVSTNLSGAKSDMRKAVREDLEKARNEANTIRREMADARKDIEREVVQLKKEVDGKIQKAIDNPLAGK